jgi:hypothetical protein
VSTLKTVGSLFVFVLAATELCGAEGCANYSELLKHGHMELGVRIAASDPGVASQFRRAMDFWAGILDMEWHEDDSENCAIEVVDGGRGLFRPMNGVVAARAQFPSQANFQGVIAFNERMTLTRTELYMIAVHEIGHLFGLQHNPNPMSVMYYMDLEGSESLDSNDLASLSALHKLRLSRAGN